ncbi:hypothetical protein JHS3_28410 [Jeongeupia sp. HS-3]|uniref:tetratricopeptide repeat protein n=1 Tax=Jeongeupia sp. HS-3 TaxID=1009682 RepID=UPI0018A623F3|nr:tetratricopeptide repeat protein [Jeongeupia sp. HS-3]BCL77105.1 hypothetical protein JHS3_28410 [Jeongeupia sp. HS-3]
MRRFLSLILPLGALLTACAQTPTQVAQAQQQQLAEQARQTSGDAPVKTADARGAYVSMIASLQAQGTHYAALSHLDSLENSYGSSPQTQLMRARAERATGNAAAARQRYESLLNGPQRAAAEHGLALIYAGEQNWGKAHQYLTDATRDAPTNPAAWNDLGYLALLRGDWAGASQALARAVELAPSDPRFRANLALYRQLSSGAADPGIPGEIAQRIGTESSLWQQPTASGLQMAQTLDTAPR